MKNKACLAVVSLRRALEAHDGMGHEKPPVLLERKQLLRMPQVSQAYYQITRPRLLRFRRVLKEICHGDFPVFRSFVTHKILIKEQELRGRNQLNFWRENKQ